MRKLYRWITICLCLAIFASGCNSVRIVKVEPTETPLLPTETPIPPTPSPTAIPQVRHIEESGGFSYLIPEGWVVKTVPGLQYAMIEEDNPSADFVQNVVLTEYNDCFNINTYVENDLLPALDLLTNYEIRRTENFETAYGIKGVVVRGSLNNGIMKVAQNIYNLDLGAKKLILTFSVNQDNQETSKIARELVDSLELLDPLAFSEEEAELCGDMKLRHFEANGNFSYIPPESWQESKDPTISIFSLWKAPGWQGEIENNIVIFEERYSGTLESYVENTKEIIEQANPDLTMETAIPIQTDSGLNGYELSQKARSESWDYSMSQFFLEKGSRKFVISFVAEQKNGAALIEAARALVKSFKLEEEMITDIDDDNRYYEESGEFSFIVPENWELDSYPNEQYKMLFKYDSEGFVLAYANFFVESFNGNLTNYVNLMTTSLEEVDQEFEKVHQKDFVTSSGVPYTEVLIKVNSDGTDLFQAYYFFDFGMRKFAISFISSANQYQENVRELAVLLDSVRDER